MSAKEEIIVLKTSLLETYQESIQQHQLLYGMLSLSITIIIINNIDRINDKEGQ